MMVLAGKFALPSTIQFCSILITLATHPVQTKAQNAHQAAAPNTATAETPPSTAPVLVNTLSAPAAPTPMSLAPGNLPLPAA